MVARCHTYMFQTDIANDLLRLTALPHSFQLSQEHESGGQDNIDIPKQRLGLVYRDDAGAGRLGEVTKGVGI